MSSQLLVQATGNLAMIAAIVGIVAGVKAVALVLRTWIEQVFQTRRLVKALEGVKPSQRPDIITACGQFEGAAASDPADEASPSDGNFRSLGPSSRNKRGGKRRKER